MKTMIYTLGAKLSNGTKGTCCKACWKGPWKSVISLKGNLHSDPLSKAAPK